MEELTQEFREDIVAVSKISVLPLILEVICKTTVMGFSAVARVTPDRWITCGVRDEIMFGLLTGSELKVDTTICHEIRQSGQPVIIDHVANDEFYAAHHTPAMYGFQSYISVPIHRQAGAFFGTLCAIDPSPATLNIPEIRAMFKTYAALISFLLSAEEIMSATEIKKLEDHVAEELKLLLHTLPAKEEGEQTGPQKMAARAYRRSPEFAQSIQLSTERIQHLLKSLKHSVKFL